MKYLIMFLILTGLTFAQTGGKLVGDGAVWTDSLGYTNLDETSDSVLILETRHYNWFKIFLDGNSNAQADSLYLQSGSFVWSEVDTVADTVWGSWAALKDSAWTDTNIMINNTVGKHYLLFDPVSDLLRFTLLNYRAAIPTRNCRITIKAVKQ